MKTAEGTSWPTVVIGGAPRSGTSSLYDLLHSTDAFHRHPRKELFLLNDKNFWIQGTSPGYAEVGAQCYDLAGFRREDCFIDASTTYLYQETAPAACAYWLSLSRDSPLIVVFCLREPAERLYSNFHYFRDVLLRIPERITFAEYVESLFDGTQRTGNQQIDQALEHGLYPNYFKRWEAAVGTERIALVRTEELAVGPDSVVSRIAARIGVSLTIGVSEKKNESYRPRFRAPQSVARLLGSKIPHGQLREFLKEAYVRLIPKAGRGSVRQEDIGALERVRNYYRPHSAAFAAYGLTWYGPA